MCKAQDIVWLVRPSGSLGPRMRKRSFVSHSRLSGLVLCILPIVFEVTVLYRSTAALRHMQSVLKPKPQKDVLSTW